MTYPKQRFKMTRPPYEQQQGEPDRAYRLFQAYLNSDGKITYTDLAVETGYKPSTVAKHAQTYKWQERVVMVRGLQLSPVHLTIADPGMTPEEEVEQGQQEPLDPAMTRVVSAEEVTAAGYTNVSNLHAQLLRHAERAVGEVRTDNLSMSDLKSLVSLVSSLQDQKLAIAKDLLSIEELAQALVEVRRKRGGRK